VLALIAHNSADMFGIGLAIRDRSSTTTKQTFSSSYHSFLGRFILNHRHVQLGRPEGFSAWPTTADPLIRWVLSVDL
jgi:hypothetical protein